MLRKRVIPILLCRNGSLVKTVNFKNFTYIGDPCNTVRIFNELEVDELIVCDILSSRNGTEPDFKTLENVASECFMPLAYGGGISSLDHAKKIFDLGFEKIVVNSASFNNLRLLSRIADSYGSQALVSSIDVKTNIFGRQHVYSFSGSVNTKFNPLIWAKKVEESGAGELLLTSIDNEGTWSGCDLNLINQIAPSISIPLIAHGGVGSIQDINKILSETEASAVGLGNLVVFQRKGKGVLINFPELDLLKLEP
ncbi:MAG: imidazole glycerol phosphate synthase subunit HisF [Candidatus Endolissoclinum sp. TMED37]|nr:MAG: imidazole glycerol phosphate synthase subunit HisF [Candidatus Endolissoclinum sp. TMED37]|tara:strand:- start:1871 stop:2629 length:759 start_codon:yes stop_codon:yes gene_type:complete